MAYDADGSIVWIIRNQDIGEGTAVNWSTAPTNFITDVTSGEKVILNNEDSNPFQGSCGTCWFSETVSSSDNVKPGYCAVVFPELRDLFAAWWHIQVSGGAQDRLYEIQSSGDTTNGVDGTWVSHSNISLPGSVYSDAVVSAELGYRTKFSTSYTGTAIRGFRFIVYNNFSGVSIYRMYMNILHLYGGISTGETPDRLLFIDNLTGLEFVGPLDWGDVARGSTIDYDIKVKNNSSTLSATDTDFSFEALTGTSNTFYTLSDSGGTFASTLNIPGSIAAGATYPAADTITVRLTLSPTEALSLQAARLKMFTNTWA